MTDNECNFKMPSFKKTTCTDCKITIEGDEVHYLKIGKEKRKAFCFPCLLKNTPKLLRKEKKK